MKKIISLTAISLMLSFVIMDSPAVLAGGGPMAPAPVRRTVPTTPKPTPAAPTTPASVPASNPASVPAATVPMASPGIGNYNAGPYDCGNCSYGNFAGYGSCVSGNCRSCNNGVKVVVITKDNDCNRCSNGCGFCGGYGRVMRLMNQGNIAGARAVLRSMNRSFYFGGCTGI